MSKPLVAVVGKPNVGKSTFFNKVSGDRKSIVLDTPGITRDRIYADVEWCGAKFTLVDTGGISLGDNDEISKHIRKQAQIAMDISDVILFFVDGKNGVTAEDYDVALIGCGAYGFHLAAHAKRRGKVGLHMASYVQLLFGIRGARWDADPEYSRFYNDAWVRPSADERPAGAETIEGGCYW